MDQPLGLAGFPNDLLDAVIFAESPKLTDKLDFNAMFLCNALGISEKSRGIKLNISA